MKIVIIAHEGKKTLAQNFCIAYRGILSKHDIYTTGTTGRMIEDAANLKCNKYFPGSIGGIKQILAEIEYNNIEVVIFLRNPELTGQDAEDLNEIVRKCDVANIPVATNLATAELIVKSLAYLEDIIIDK